VSKSFDPNDVRVPDAFHVAADKSMDFVAKNAKVFLAAFLVLLIGGVGYAAYGFLESRKERMAIEGLYPAEAELKKAQGGNDSELPIPPVVNAADYDKKYATAVSKYQAQIQSFSDTKAAAVAAMNLSSFLRQQKRYEEAMKVLEIPRFRPSNQDLMAGFWHMHRGIVFLENKAHDQALEAYQNVLKDNALKLFHSEALLKLGFCYEQKGETAKAQESYERIEREFPNTDAAQAAQQYLRILQLKSIKQG